MCVLRRHLRQVPTSGRAEVHPLRQEGSPRRRLRVQGTEHAQAGPKDVRQGGVGRVRGARGERLDRGHRHRVRPSAHAEDLATLATRWGRVLPQLLARLRRVQDDNRLRSGQQPGRTIGPRGEDQFEGRKRGEDGVRRRGHPRRPAGQEESHHQGPCIVGLAEARSLWAGER
jgi:hypothetical protein